MKSKNIKKCVICGGVFTAPPSSKKITCSAECSAKRKSLTHKGIKISDEVRAKYSKAKKGKKPEQLSKGNPAAMLSPLSGRFDTNSSAKEWTLLSPTGEIYKFTNLNNFIRKNIDKFGYALTDENCLKVRQQFAYIKSRLKKGIYKDYNGWTIIAWSDEKNIERKKKSC